MRPADLFLFLLGNRGAIERIATSRRALWAGALLVLSAGIARNYDHLYLLAQPEWIYGPFGMSVFSAVFIWLILREEISSNSDGPGPSTFRAFLTLFWLTAPCAWLYGFPVEHFTDLMTATKWNFAFLLVVAVWRVALMVRAVTVLTGAGTGRILSFVLLPACIEMHFGSLWKGMSLVGIMGGVRLPPHHEFLKEASSTVVVSSFLLGAASLLAIIIYGFLGSGLAVQPIWRNPAQERKGVLLTAAACLAAWVAIAIPVQGPVGLNYQLGRFFANKQWHEGIAYAASRQPSDFSPIHFLPPDPYKSIHASTYSYLKLLEAMDGSEPAWLREIWTTQATMALEVRIPFDWSDENAFKTLSRYPTIMAGLTVKAERLKSQPHPGMADEDWLRNYKESFEPDVSAKTAPP